MLGFSLSLVGERGERRDVPAVLLHILSLSITNLLAVKLVVDAVVFVFNAEDVVVVVDD